jgi:lipopolysaccharide transport system permease protein
MTTTSTAPGSLPAEPARSAVVPGPHTALLPNHDWAWPDFGEVWRFRELLLTFTIRDLKVRYKQTALGVAWIVLQPLLAAIVLAFVFGRVIKIGTPSDPLYGPVPYLPFAFAGTAAWGLFGYIVSRAGQSMVQNSHLISKIYFPRILLPGATALATLVDLAVTLVVLSAAILFMWHAPRPGQIWLAPLCLMLLTALGLGVGLFATALSVAYRDVQQVIPVIVQLLFLASPIVYDVSTLVRDQGDSTWLGIYMLNPIAPIMQAWRWSVLGVGQVYWGYLAYAAAVSVIVLFVGVVVFRRMERTFADIV